MNCVSREVYVVEGRTGEFSDREEWSVAAYLDEGMAELHRKRAQDHFDKWCERHPGWRHSGLEREFTSPYDPHVRVDSCGPGLKYVTYPVPMLDSPPP